LKAAEPSTHIPSLHCPTPLSLSLHVSQASAAAVSRLRVRGNSWPPAPMEGKVRLPPDLLLLVRALFVPPEPSIVAASRLTGGTHTLSPSISWSPLNPSQCREGAEALSPSLYCGREEDSNSLEPKAPNALHLCVDEQSNG
jgi:hypothetical protein